MLTRKCTGLHGEKRDYALYPKAIPPFETSDYIQGVLFDTYRYHSGEGDMWPITWASDDALYCGAGDNKGCPMNLWRVQTLRFSPESLTSTGQWSIDMINPEPVPLSSLSGRTDVCGVKPAGLLDVDGVLYLSVEAQNYGDQPLFSRQHNLFGWIVTSRGRGKSFDAAATPQDFFNGRLASCHFLQFGRGYSGARDGFVYAYFPCDLEDGQSYWENNDALLLGRVPKERLLERDAWEFYASDSPAVPAWSKASICLPQDDGSEPCHLQPGHRAVSDGKLQLCGQRAPSAPDPSDGVSGIKHQSAHSL